MHIVPKSYDNLAVKVFQLLDDNPGQTIKDLAKQLKINRSFLAGYLKALEDQGLVRSKRIGPQKYTSIKGGRRRARHEISRFIRT